MAILTIQELADHLQMSIVGDIPEAAAQAAIEDASAVVINFCGRVSQPWDEATGPEAVKAVAKRLAARIYENPAQRTSYAGPDGLTFSGGPVRLLTDDEREQLMMFRRRSSKVGHIASPSAPWLST